MNVRCVGPRKRIEVRAGEVSKGQVAKNAHIMSEATTLVEKLGAGPGVITLQLFLTGDGSIKYIEINPRFGGGAPLSIKVGAETHCALVSGWDKQTIAGTKFYNTSFDSENRPAAGQHNQRFHLPGRQQQLAVFALVALIDRKVFAIGQQAYRRYEKIVTGLIEMDALKCLLNMQLSGPADIVQSVPVKDSVRRIRRCLNLGYQQARPDRMGGPRRQKVALAGFDRHLAQGFGDGAGFSCLAK